MRLRIGTRESKLAIAQTLAVQQRLMPYVDEIEIVPMKTTGDKILAKSLAEIGGKGLFTKELEEALLDHSIDMAVHSMKDMPALFPSGLIIGAILPREDPRDAFLGHTAPTLADLPQGAKIGTSSVRRQAQLLALRPDLEILPLRGNVLTRLQKLEHGPFDATVLAVAGLKRLEIADTIYHPIDTKLMLPAVAQGAIGVQCRAEDVAICRLLDQINHQDSAIQVEAERSFLKVLDGSCRTPLAALAQLSEDGSHLTLQTLVASPDGKKIATAHRSGHREDAALLGEDAGKELKPWLERV